MKKYNIDQSLMEISVEDQIWAYNTVFSHQAMELKHHLDQHYWNKHIDSLGIPIKGWNSLTYHLKK